MPKRKKFDNPDQLSLFNLLNYDSISEITEQVVEINDEFNPLNITDNQENFELIEIEGTDSISKNTKNNDPIILGNKTNNIDKLFLPFTYEEILEKIDKNMARLPDLIVPVTEFEELIIQVVVDIKSAGYLLFLYGISGVGKST